MYLPFVATLALCRGDFTHFLLSFFLKGGKGNNMAILFGMIWLDFASVCYIRQAPRFAYSVEYSDETVIYHAPFYSVYKYGRDTLGEYYQVYIGFDNL